MAKAFPEIREELVFWAPVCGAIPLTAPGLEITKVQNPEWMRGAKNPGECVTADALDSEN